MTLTDGHPLAARALARNVWLNAPNGLIGYHQPEGVAGGSGDIHSDCLVFDSSAAEKRRDAAVSWCSSNDIRRCCNDFLYQHTPLHSRALAEDIVREAEKRLKQRTSETEPFVQTKEIGACSSSEKHIDAPSKSPLAVSRNEFSSQVAAEGHSASVISPTTSFMIGFLLATPLQAAELGLSCVADATAPNISASPLYLPRAAITASATESEIARQEHQQQLFGPVAFPSDSPLLLSTMGSAEAITRSGHPAPSLPSLSLGPPAAVEVPISSSTLSPAQTHDVKMDGESMGAANVMRPYEAAISSRHAAQRRKRRLRQRLAAERTELAVALATRTSLEVLQGQRVLEQGEGVGSGEERVEGVITATAASDDVGVASIEIDRWHMEATAVAETVLGLVNTVVSMHRRRGPLHPRLSSDEIMPAAPDEERVPAAAASCEALPSSAPVSERTSHVAAYDLIIAADVLFFEDFHDDLLHATAVLLATAQRTPGHPKVAAAPHWSWRMTQKHEADTAIQGAAGSTPSPPFSPDVAFDPAESLRSRQPQAWFLAPRRGGSLSRFVERARNFVLEGSTCCCHTDGDYTAPVSRCSWRPFDVAVYTDVGLQTADVSLLVQPPSFSGTLDSSVAEDNRMPLLVVLRLRACP